MTAAVTACACVPTMLFRHYMVLPSPIERQADK